jgi:hypothetical protein
MSVHTSCECYPLITYDGGTPLTSKEVAHQLHLDIERLRQSVEEVARYCPNDADSIKAALSNAARKGVRLEGLISREENISRVLLDNGKKIALCQRGELSCGKEIFYCWVVGSRDTFVVDSIEEAKSHLALTRSDGAFERSDLSRPFKGLIRILS